MEQFFHIRARGSSVKTEFRAGLSTFFAMAYILLVNAALFANPLGDGSNPLEVSYGAVYIATALSAVAGCVLVALLANAPLAMASGMGLNAFFVYTICISYGLTYANALLLVLFDGILFLILTSTGLRSRILHSIPDSVRLAIGPGLGLLIAFLGLQNAGLVLPDGSSCVRLVSFNLLTGSWADIMPPLVALATFLIIVVMAAKKIRGAALWGILIGVAVYYLLGLTVPGFYDQFSVELSSPLAAFHEFRDQSLFRVFREGFNFSGLLAGKGSAALVLTLATTALSLCMVDMFDTLGTLYASCEACGFDRESGIIDRAMFADSLGTICGAVCGTSTVTTFAESMLGVSEGGRTGLAALVTAGCFAIAMFVTPLAQLIPGCVISAALIYVGVVMAGGLGRIAWNKPTVAVPAFLTVVMMPFTSNVSYGIVFGMISHVVMHICLGKAKQLSAATLVITGLFLVTLFLTH